MAHASCPFAVSQRVDNKYVTKNRSRNTGPQEHVNPDKQYGASSTCKQADMGATAARTADCGPVSRTASSKSFETGTICVSPAGDVAMKKRAQHALSRGRGNVSAVLAVLSGSLLWHAGSRCARPPVSRITCFLAEEDVVTVLLYKATLVMG